MQIKFLPLVIISFCAFSQSPVSKTPIAAAPPAPKEEKLASLTIPFNPDSYVTTEHVTTIKGQKVPFQAMTGTMPVWD
jgi:hypothetical protein